MHVINFLAISLLINYDYNINNAFTFKGLSNHLIKILQVLLFALLCPISIFASACPVLSLKFQIIII